jgi:hypothetical protein
VAELSCSFGSRAAVTDCVQACSGSVLCLSTAAVLCPADTAWFLWLLKASDAQWALLYGPTLVVGLRAQCVRLPTRLFLSIADDVVVPLCCTVCYMLYSTAGSVCCCPSQVQGACCRRADVMLPCCTYAVILLYFCCTSAVYCTVLYCTGSVCCCPSQVQGVCVHRLPV